MYTRYSADFRTDETRSVRTGKKSSAIISKLCAQKMNISPYNEKPPAPKDKHVSDSEGSATRNTMPITAFAPTLILTRTQVYCVSSVPSQSLLPPHAICGHLKRPYNNQPQVFLFFSFRPRIRQTQLFNSPAEHSKVDKEESLPLGKDSQKTGASENLSAPSELGAP